MRRIKYTGRPFRAVWQFFGVKSHGKFAVKSVRRCRKSSVTRRSNTKDVQISTKRPSKVLYFLRALRV